MMARMDYDPLHRAAEAAGAGSRLARAAAADPHSATTFAVQAEEQIREALRALEQYRRETRPAAKVTPLLSLVPPSAEVA